MANSKEAQSRIKINKFLEDAGWRFFDTEKGEANIRLEASVKITQQDIDEMGEDFENTQRGFVDYLLLDDKGFPFVVLEAKREGKNPLDGKEQARRYAQSQNARFVLLSNGNTHYFWDLESGNPEVIIEFPKQESLLHRSGFQPDNQRLSSESVKEDYIALTQNPNYKEDPRYRDKSTREEYLSQEDLRILRPYQLRAIHALQKSAGEGSTRFLFEMATGTGKTLVAGAVIKLFLRTGNAKRILFLVDRVELKNQAYDNFNTYLKNDCTSVIYKNNRDDWQKAEIVISTVQSLASQDKYKKFSPTDFGLVISDEAHRSIGGSNGNYRAVFEYFVGYKLGLTATPKDYLKNVDSQKLPQKDPRAWERRQLLDTYTTFGCPSGEPTFRYTLISGVKDEYLINPIAVDARTEITTQLLSEKGYAIIAENDEGEKEEGVFFHKDFEKKFFSDNTNKAFCGTIIKNALRDPISREIGKTIVFCVRQSHASKITQILNQMADKVWPGKYNSDFAVQVTSNVPDAQQMTMNFANNNLTGRTNFLPGYKSSKTRVCVTVGMMTTGYDCKDILNLALLRPIFSPTDFVQIKGRGTRKFTFGYKNEDGEEIKKEKDTFKMFDFFANCEYFEEKFDYDEALQLSVAQRNGSSFSADDFSIQSTMDEATTYAPDTVTRYKEKQISSAGMKVDRKLFEKAKEEIGKDKDIQDAVMQEQWDKAINITVHKYQDKPELYINLDKLRRSESLDRRLTWREVLERVFGFVDTFPSKDEKLEEECEKFISIDKPKSKYVPYIKNFIKAYLTDERFHAIIENRNYGELNNYAGFPMSDFKALGEDLRKKLPEYIKDYIPINQYKE
ncbi:MAG: DEAD/DEAH box helicase [Candidatus Spechtbacteria bacterium SB0662_bin_43]|uniref:DEAD/DEAH box helicase n=1 Tax=Candidatus Spechtbacteria bacterium SB0662_bin_43 TaxID=2604897 RepID=A0A845D9B1_9BACT|nr:DEAD/DEAH box helicase [Candidatus Spechtbacteria bacterium SB0662_bin_43]